MNQPLAEILRPRTLDSYVGQSHLVGKGSILRVAIENGNLHSMILWGPPGVGKTTLALLLSELTGTDFYMLSAINSGVKDIREVFEKAEKSGRKSILFIDEIHRFSKSQQDSLLGAVERGLVTLIGATTENPSFEVISPLLSRCQVYVLKNLERQELEQITETACHYLEGKLDCCIEVVENEALLRVSGGDARKLINAIELVANTLSPVDGVVRFTNEAVLKIIQKNLVVYDKKGENHYDIISAFIKSIRGSDPNAAVYWLARMLEAGEDPLFIARRMIILSSEDIGNANPNALLLANNCFQAVHQIGMPEARIILSQTATYLASSAKSNAAYLAIDEALEWVKKTGNLPVPLHIRNAPTKLMKDLGYSKNYQYAHNHDNNFVEQEFLPTSISGKKFYDPQDNPRENELRKYLRNCWKDKYKYVILLLLSFCSLFSLTAQDFHYSQFFATTIDESPAMAGAFDGIVRGRLHHRTQWLAVTRPFLTFTFAADAPVWKNHRKAEMIGVGLSLRSDQAGDSRFTSNSALLTLSYVKGIGRRNRHKLGIGFQGGVAHRAINYQHLNFDEQFINPYFDPNNPVTESFEKESFFFFDCSAGLFWSYSPNRDNTFVIATSLHHLSQSKQIFYKEDISLQPRFTSYFYSKIKLNRNLFLEPALLATYQGKYSEYLLGSNIEYFHRKNSYTPGISFGGGLFYRWNDALVVNALLEWQNIRFCFSYDVNLSSFMSATNARGGFELSLRYIFKKRLITKLGKEPCPFDIM